MATETPYSASRETGPTPTLGGGCQAVLVGSEASRLLASPGLRGRVIASVSGAAYIEADEGDAGDGSILALGASTLPAHRRFILSPGVPASLRPGSRVLGDGETLVFEDGTHLYLGEAPVWEGPHVGPEMAASPADVAVRGARAAREALLLHHGDNLGLALPMLAQCWRGGSPVQPTGCSSPLLQAAAGPVTGIVRACGAGRLDLALDHGQSLIGLGPGLTPAGDDFVGGVLFAAWHLGVTYPSLCPWDDEPVRALVASWAPLTSRISHAYLEDFSCGQGPEPLHGLMEALLTRGLPSETMAHVQRVVRIGQSSGWAMLTGALAGVQLLGGRR